MKRMMHYVLAAGACLCLAADKPNPVAAVKPEDPIAARAIKEFGQERFVKVTMHADGTIRSLYVGRLAYTPEILEQLRGLTRLEYISLNGPQITDDTIRHLQGLGSLKRLHLGSARFSDMGYSSTSITGAGLVHLKGLTQLEDLRIATTKRIDDRGLNHIRGLKNLTWLYIENEKLPFDGRRIEDDATTAGPADENITDAGLVHLKEMTKLDHLLLGRTEVRGPGMVHLVRLQNLRRVYLHFSPITDAGVPHLARLKSLEHLGLGGTKVSDEGVKTLQHELPDCGIGLPIPVLPGSVERLLKKLRE